MDDGFKPATKQLHIEARLRSDKAGAGAIVYVDNEYADEFNLNDIGLAMFLSAYRALP
jgi:hypothetical protein